MRVRIALFEGEPLTVGREHGQFIYNNSLFLLIIAMGKKALFRYYGFANLQEHEIPISKNKLML